MRLPMLLISIMLGTLLLASFAQASVPGPYADRITAARAASGHETVLGSYYRSHASPGPAAARVSVKSYINPRLAEQAATYRTRMSTAAGASASRAYRKGMARSAAAYQPQRVLGVYSYKGLGRRGYTSENRSYFRPRILGEAPSAAYGQAYRNKASSYSAAYAGSTARQAERLIGRYSYRSRESARRFRGTTYGHSSSARAPTAAERSRRYNTYFSY